MGLPRTNDAKQQSTKVYIDLDKYQSNAPKESILDYLKKAIATTGDLKPEDTELGKGLLSAWEFSGSPYVDIKESVGDGSAYFKQQSGVPFPTDTVEVYPQNTNSLLEELAHAKQYLQTQNIRNYLNRSAISEESDRNRYETPGTVEYEAHKILYPALKRKFGL